ncbi:hypothetical protein QGN23_00195 [Chryseobacterium gotjawalense]|uniref:Uncharacterized protein n=1 Tax=Chryseobacterium gotjawalense TaxID=3042315 RepID=A0ABY8RCL0_9FLAO|nr:hypothetical protein [Chryseobacterium sp. wdc7]WHF51720.1 hypothetical protein QGN23_00195 [Chryseobacterium sp. wdc7]
MMIVPTDLKIAGSTELHHIKNIAGKEPETHRDGLEYYGKL